MFYFIIIIIFLLFNISIILSCVYVSSFLDFISILIHLVDDQVDLGTKVHLKWELNVFSNLKYSHKELFITQNLYQYHGP